jgi:hypothetical protein
MFAESADPVWHGMSIVHDEGGHAGALPSYWGRTRGSRRSPRHTGRLLCGLVAGEWPAGGRGRVAWGTATLCGAVVVAYMVVWTVRGQVGVLSLVAGLPLSLLELAAYLLGLAYLWEMVDVLAARAWGAATDSR